MKKLRTLFVVTLVAANMVASSVMANSDEMLVAVSYDNQDQLIRQKIREHIGDPLIEVIAACESTGNPHLIQHWNADGSLLKKPTSSASGSLQVLLEYHSEWIEAEGRNMYDIDEYMMFVETILDTQGYGAWSQSEGCWGRYAHLGTS